ncbi:Allene oxide synthase [Morella rubra]|uniref:Allene oxide synthase n=1 Tax=Morella rubra TaxID=262757 RepID=A0A6A1V7R0_9ROSI|nr:Allene oxide synthase [Morella rubra]
MKLAITWCSWPGSMHTVCSIKWVGLAGEKLHRELAHEIRTVVKDEGGVTFSALDKMSLTKSAVYEALRMEPPVAFQYGKAKEDIVIHSHDAAFEIKKGEMIFGYQQFATRDPKIFEDAEEFVRFVGEGEKMLKYIGQMGVRLMIQRRTISSARGRIWWCLCLG